MHGYLVQKRTIAEKKKKNSNALPQIPIVDKKFGPKNGFSLPRIKTEHSVMVNFKGHLDWAKGCPESW